VLFDTGEDFEMHVFELWRCNVENEIIIKGKGHCRDFINNIQFSSIQTERGQAEQRKKLIEKFGITESGT
jgi:hypothetical protein